MNRLNDNTLTDLVDIAARKYWERFEAINPMAHKWEELGPYEKMQVRELVLPIVLDASTAMLEMGYEKNRVLITEKELMDLPIGTVVRSYAGTVAERETDRYGIIFGSDYVFPWATLVLPVTILLEPTKSPA